jgi:hypothetical protein
MRDGLSGGLILSLALQALGERESGTGRLEEARGAIDSAWDGYRDRRRDAGGSERRAAVVGEVSIGRPTAKALPNPTTARPVPWSGQ